MAAVPVLNPTPQRPVTVSPAAVAAGNLANRSLSLYAYGAVKKTWDAIIAVAHFIFLELIPGVVYYLPRALVYQLPQLINRLHTNLDRAEELLKDEYLHRVAVNILDVLDKTTDPASAEARAQIAVAVTRTARYVVDDEAAVDAISARLLMRAAREAVDEWNGHAVAGRSIWTRLFKVGSSSPAAGGGAGMQSAAAHEEEPAEPEANAVVAMFQSFYTALTAVKRSSSTATASPAVEASVSGSASRSRSPFFSLASLRSSTFFAQPAGGQLPGVAAAAPAPPAPPRS